MLFAIPSRGRAQSVKSADILKCAVLFVPENEVGIYVKAKPGHKVVGVPSSVRGITKTRNWILKNCGDSRIVFVDDDVKAQGYVKLLKEKSRHIKLKESDWLKISNELFDITEDLGWKIWGVATQSAPRAIYPYSPILTRSYVTASFMGMINDGSFYFDEDFPVKEDYEVCLRHIKEKGGVLAARHIYWENSHWTDGGGCKDYRTGKMELDCIKKLIKKYPGMIRQVKRGGSDYSISLEF
jgi:hypothetical protein